MAKIDMMNVVIITLFIPEVGLMKFIDFLFRDVLKMMVKLTTHNSEKLKQKLACSICRGILHTPITSKARPSSRPTANLIDIHEPLM